MKRNTHTFKDNIYQLFVRALKHNAHLTCVLALCLLNAPSLSLANNNQKSESLPEKLHINVKPFDAKFVAYRAGSDVGYAVLSLKTVDANEYELTYKSKLSRFFLSDKRYEKSLFKIENDVFVPLHYEYKRTGTGSNKSLSLNFNEEKQKIHIDEKTSLDWAGEFDNQLFRIDLPQKLAAGNEEARYDFINYRGEKRRYDVSVQAQENLSLPYGQLNAIKVKIDRQSNSRVTYAWFAPSLDYNLVRLQQFKNDKEQGDIQLESFSYF